jgi:hypothetical protein
VALEFLSLGTSAQQRYEKNEKVQLSLPFLPLLAFQIYLKSLKKWSPLLKSCHWCAAQQSSLAHQQYLLRLA